MQHATKRNTQTAIRIRFRDPYDKKFRLHIPFDSQSHYSKQQPTSNNFNLHGRGMICRLQAAPRRLGAWSLVIKVIKPKEKSQKWQATYLGTRSYGFSRVVPDGKVECGSSRAAFSTCVAHHTSSATHLLTATSANKPR